MVVRFYSCYDYFYFFLLGGLGLTYQAYIPRLSFLELRLKLFYTKLTCLINYFKYLLSN